ncbi:related to 54S ribosomal protein L36, mitochondrial [Saccharomycodes ludwigii]|uniref:Related to 54S ribosomal protein L36, mitochondrial n=1 Tax=Saccharomycodes ludwigii TaxID=36035 RepID=A0A376B6W0_9ASCO|nr:hypothetical protein SCDLUD_000545 [Saccharomycodes ludwigii]KAH3902946.1 hypothetical protein SCDLUD_000545 [Saccharomycodes ludwigii]SSD60426.1 related to 54S ribosomal protein L36, mitochondrial [Saccharomycodes ludwigii]
MNNLFRYTAKRLASGTASSGGGRMRGINPQFNIPKRPMKKIFIGKARPAIYHQFEVLVELSDGSVIKRKSQYPKAEIRLIQDQRNNPLWNQSRDDLVLVDANSGGKLDKFKQKYSNMFTVADTENETNVQNNTSNKQQTSNPTVIAKNAEKASTNSTDEFDMFGEEDYLSLLDDSTAGVKNGSVASNKTSAKKKK